MALAARSAAGASAVRCRTSGGDESQTSKAAAGVTTVSQVIQNLTGRTPTDGNGLQWTWVA
jgi:hypothetical protein